MKAAAQTTHSLTHSLTRSFEYRVRAMGERDLLLLQCREIEGAGGESPRTRRRPNPGVTGAHTHARVRRLGAERGRVVLPHVVLAWHEQPTLVN